METLSSSPRLSADTEDSFAYPKSTFMEADYYLMTSPRGKEEPLSVYAKRRIQGILTGGYKTFQATAQGAAESNEKFVKNIINKGTKGQLAQARYRTFSPMKYLITPFIMTVGTLDAIFAPETQQRKYVRAHFPDKATLDFKMERQAQMDSNKQSATTFTFPDETFLNKLYHIFVAPLKFTYGFEADRKLNQQEREALHLSVMGEPMPVNDLTRDELLSMFADAAQNIPEQNKETKEQNTIKFVALAELGILAFENRKLIGDNIAALVQECKKTVGPDLAAPSEIVEEFTPAPNVNGTTPAASERIFLERDVRKIIDYMNQINQALGPEYGFAPPAKAEETVVPQQTPTVHHDHSLPSKGHYTEAFASSSRRAAASGKGR